MKCRPALFLSFFLMSFISFAAPGKQPHGEVADADGLLKVHAFCIDQSALTPHQSADLEKFVAQGSKPKGLFIKLNWQYLAVCPAALID
jgi:hypothetical protein